MVMDRFITAQQRCGLRRHLDSVPPDTPIRDIVDRCCVWESHSEQKKGSAPGAGLDQDLPGKSGDSREPRFFRLYLFDPVGCPEVDSQISVPVANVIQSDTVAQRNGGARMQSGRPLEIMSSLIARLLRAAQEDHPAEVKLPPDDGARPPSAVPELGITGCSQLSEVEQVMVCFSCGRQGHGANRCSWVDTSFPFLPQGWSVDVRGGQYQAVWPGGTREWSPPGNEVWSGREGQPLGSSGTREQLTPAGESVFLGEASRHGSCRWGVSMAPVGLRARKLFRHWGATLHKYMSRITERCRSWPGRCWEEGIRLCRTLRLGWVGAHHRWSPSVRSSAIWEGDAACRRE